MEEKLRSMRQSRDEAQSHCTQQKQTITELHSRAGQQSIETDTLRRRIDELQQVRGQASGPGLYDTYRICPDLPATNDRGLIDLFVCLSLTSQIGSKIHMMVHLPSITSAQSQDFWAK